MAEKNEEVDIGRVFFEPTIGPNLKYVTVLKLESHVGNVVQLVRRFDPKHFKVDCSETRDWLIRAAHKHDDAKPITFRVLYRDTKQGGEKCLAYSFAGHRFRVFDDNRYVELLIRLHHEFSVEGIAKAVAELKTQHNGKYAKFADNFPIDLYTLEMCDQIEAEVETYAFTGNVQPRVFMDFHSRMIEDRRVVEVTPYPFGNEEISLPLTYYQFDVPKADCYRIAEALAGDSSQKGLSHLREMIVKAHTYTKCQRKDMILCKAY